MIRYLKSRRTVPSIILAVLCAAGALLVNAGPLTPEKNITVVTKEQQIPEWKTLWDEARILAARQETDAAITWYLKVLALKPHIEEVKWELSRLYLKQKQFDKALVILESLLEASPDKLDYLVSAGEAALQNRKAGLAATYFGQALALDPSGPSSELALIGMVGSLKAQGKHSIAVPLMEQLYQRGVVSSDMLLDLARFYAEQKDFDKASYYFRELIKRFQVQDDVLAEAAFSFENSKDLEAAAEQWEAYLKNHPDYREFRIKLADYYRAEKRYEDALLHLLYLMEHDIDRQRYLLAVARTYLYELGRSDRALYYFEQYQQEYPEGVDVSEEIAGLQMIMANDLLSIVENNGVWMLWRDLAEVTPGRIGIYRAMADMLRQMGPEKERQLIEILKIINAHEPADIDVVKQLVYLFRKTGRIDECGDFLDRVQGTAGHPAEIQLLQAQCQSSAGDDLGRLKSYTAYLQLRPADKNIRLLALQLAGALGLVEELEELYQASRASAPQNMTDPDFEYAVQLSKNGLSRSAETFMDGFGPGNIEPDKQMILTRDLALLDLDQNRPYKAEQDCRIFASSHPESADGILLLADFFLHKQDVSSARFWHGMIERLGLELSAAQKSLQFYQELMIDRALTKVDVYQRALVFLDARMKINRIIAEDVEVLLFAAEHYLQTKRFDECIRLINRYRQKFKGVNRVAAMLTIARKERSAKKMPWSDMPLEDIPLSIRIAVGEQLLRMGRSADAEAVLTDVAAELPESVLTRYLLADLYLMRLDYNQAAAVYTDLRQQFPAETFFREQQFLVENLLDAPRSIFDEFDVVVDESGRKSAVLPTQELLDYPEIKLMWARSLWSQDRWEESLDVYGLLDTEMKRDLDSMRQQLDKIPGEQRASVQQVLGNRATFEQAEVIDFIMSDEFVAGHLGEEIVRIGSRYYDSYRWGKIINKEMTAKSSLKAREFYQAEIDYRKLFQEEAAVTEHSYQDLATVYDRLGRYQEETVLVEKIKETNITSPDLSRITEKNIRRRQPFMFLESSYLEEKGWDGAIDITEFYSGLGLQIKPTLYQDVGVVVGLSEYGNSGGSDLASSMTILSNYSVQFSDNFEAYAKLGMEDFAEDGDTFLLYDLALKGTLERRVEFFAGVKQEPVDDTIESLLESISLRDARIGFSLDYLFGMFFGFDIDFYRYSDDNEGTQYYLWSSYRWFGDRSAVDITYSYLNLQNDLTNETVDDTAENLRLPYWSPGDYWQHLISATYKMELWPTGRLQSGTGSFSARYGLGYEKGDSLIHEVDMDILLELSPSFLVKGSVSTVLSDNYDLFTGMVSFVYRW